MNANDLNTPTAVTALGTNVAHVAFGSAHTCVVLLDATLSCWGDNFYGQLGVGDTSNRNTPTAVTALGTNVAQVATGQYCTCAVLLDASLSCWGFNEQGQLGMGDQTARNTPTALTALGTNVAEVAAGGMHACAVLSDATLSCWGMNDQGQLGVGHNTNLNTPTAVTALGTNVAQVATGLMHTCAVLLDATLLCWGFNVFGQLGVGDTSNRNTPTAVTALGTNVAHVTLGYQHTCAVLVDDTISCWGYNGNGQLGVGDYTNRNTPTAVTALGTTIG